MTAHSIAVPPSLLCLPGFLDWQPPGYSRSLPKLGKPEPAQAKERDAGVFLAMQRSPFFDIWASAGIDEMLAAMFEKLTLATP